MQTPANTEQHRHECEAREWLRRIREKAPGQRAGQALLDETLRSIAWKRGQAEADRLRATINALRAQPQEPTT